MPDLAPLHPEAIARLVSRWEPRHWTILAAVPADDWTTSADVARSAGSRARRSYSAPQAALILSRHRERGLVDRVDLPSSTVARWVLTSRGAGVLAWGRAHGQAAP